MFTPKLRFFLSMSMGVVVYLVPHHHAVAQEQSATEEDRKNRAQLEEVIVSATRRDANLQDVAASVQAVDRNLLLNNEIDNVQDLTKLVPSLQYTETFDPATSDFRIRGIGQDAGSALNVGLVVDEVPLSGGSQAAMEFADLERVEVLRGPQGTLFGKNASAGVIHFISRDASQEFEGFSRFTIEDNANWPGGMFKTQLGINGGLTDTLAGRLSGYYTQIDGHLVNITENTNPPDTESWGLRARFHWEPTDSLTIKPIFEYTDRSGEATSLALRSANPDKRSRLDPRIQLGERNRTMEAEGDDLKMLGKNFTLGIDWALGWTNFTAVTGVREFKMDRVNSVLSQTGDRNDAVSFIGVDTLTLSQELRLASPEPFEISAPFGLFTVPGTFDYTVGALWFHSESDTYLDIIVTDTPAGAGATFFSGGLINLNFVSLAPFDSLEADIYGTGYGENTNVGVFGHLTWHFSDTLRMNGGLRYIYDEYEATNDTVFDIKQEATGITVLSQGGVGSGSLKDTAVIGNWELQYDWSDHSVLYTRLATGYRAGIIQADDDDSPEVKPEFTTNIEAGIKSRLFDNRMHVNLTVFHQIIKDYQASVFKVTQNDVPVGIGLDTRTDNAGELLSQGVEFDIMVRPIESLSLTSSVSYNETRYNEFEAVCFTGQEVGERGGTDQDGDGTCDTQDLKGYSLRNAPLWAASVTGRYTKQLELLGGSSAFVQLTGRYKDKVNYTTTHLPGAYVDGFKVWDLRFGWEGLDHRLSVAAYVNNLFKEFYVTAIYPLSLENDRRDYGHFIPAAADRQYGMTLEYKF